VFLRNPYFESLFHEFSPHFITLQHDDLLSFSNRVTVKKGYHWQQLSTETG